MDEGTQTETKSGKDSAFKTPGKGSVKKPQKIDKTVVDGLLYLLEQHAIEGVTISEEAFKEKLDKIVDNDNKDKIKTYVERISETKTRQKKVDYQKLADQTGRKRTKRTRFTPKPKKKGKRNSTGDDDDDD